MTVLERCEELRSASSKTGRLFEKKRQALQERNHYAMKAWEVQTWRIGWSRGWMARFWLPPYVIWPCAAFLAFKWP